MTENTKGCVAALVLLIMIILIFFYDSQYLTLRVLAYLSGASILAAWLLQAPERLGLRGLLWNWLRKPKQ
jgi:hypothetical protein